MSVAVIVPVGMVVAVMLAMTVSVGMRVTLARFFQLDSLLRMGAVVGQRLSDRLQLQVMLFGDGGTFFRLR